MTRKVTVVNPSTNQPVEIQTSATTWGQLQSDLQTNNISTANMKGLVRETKNSLEATDAALPEGEFTLFLFAAKNKAGK